MEEEQSTGADTLGGAVIVRRRVSDWAARAGYPPEPGGMLDYLVRKNMVEPFSAWRELDWLLDVGENVIVNQMSVRLEEYYEY